MMGANAFTLPPRKLEHAPIITRTYAGRIVECRPMQFIPFPEHPRNGATPPTPLTEPLAASNDGGRGGGLHVARCGECGRDPAHPVARACDAASCPIRHHTIGNAA